MVNAHVRVSGTHTVVSAGYNQSRRRKITNSPPEMTTIRAAAIQTPQWVPNPG